MLVNNKWYSLADSYNPGNYNDKRLSKGHLPVSVDYTWLDRLKRIYLLHVMNDVEKNC